jgi:fibronectin-binding autotransporter adhesin
VTVSAGTLLIGDVAALGTGAITVSGGVLDLADLAPTNVIVLAGGALANGAVWAGTGTIQVATAADATLLNSFGAAEVTIAAGATVDLTGVTKDIVFEGGSLSNLSGYAGKVRVKGNLDVSAGDHAGELEVAAGGTVNFGNRSSDRTVKFTGGAVQGANFTGNIEVVGSGVALTSGIAAGNVRMTAGNSAAIQAGFNRAIRLEGGDLSGLDNYSGELTVAAPTFSTTGITTAATLSVESGSTLSGSGTIGGLTQVAGSVLAPGNSPGILNVTGTHVLAGDASMEVEFYDLAASTAPGTGYDAVVAGTLDLSGLTTSSRYILDLVSLSALQSTQGPLAGFDASQGYTFDLFAYTDILLPAAYAGSLDGFFTIDASAFLDAAGNSVSAAAFSVLDNTDSKIVQLVYAPIPEPSTYGLILGGLGLAAAALRRRKKVQGD